jgi:hypothetical protein
VDRPRGRLCQFDLQGKKPHDFTRGRGSPIGDTQRTPSEARRFTDGEAGGGGGAAPG